MQLKGLRLKQLWYFSVPSIVASVFEPLASVVDTALVGRLGTNQLAALALASAIFNAITWMFNFLVHVSTEGVADSKAQKDSSLLRERLKIALSLAFIIGLICSASLLIPKSFWFNLAGGDQELVEFFDAYFLPRASFHTVSLLCLTGLSLLRGLSHLKLVLNLMIVGTGLNILLSYIFLYPLDLGLAGAAWGTIISQALVLVFALIALLKDERVNLKWSNFFKTRSSMTQWVRFGKNSLNLFGRSFTLTCCFFISTRLAARLGVHQLGAHQVLLQVWLLASFFLDGLAISGNILGARFYNAKMLKRTSIVFNQLLILGVLVGLFFTFFYTFGWSWFIYFFSDDPLLIAQMQSVQVLIVIAQIFSAVAFVYDGLIFGLGGFAFLRKHMMIGALTIFVPLSLYSLKEPKLFWIWAALVSLNIYRGLSGFYFVKKQIKDKL